EVQLPLDLVPYSVLRFAFLDPMAYEVVGVLAHMGQHPRNARQMTSQRGGQGTLAIYSEYHRRIETFMLQLSDQSFATVAFAFGMLDPWGAIGDNVVDVPQMRSQGRCRRRGQQGQPSRRSLVFQCPESRRGHEDVAHIVQAHA